MRNNYLFVLLALMLSIVACKKEEKENPDWFPNPVLVSVIPKLVFTPFPKQEGAILYIAYSKSANKDLFIHVKLARINGRPDTAMTVVIPAGYDNKEAGPGEHELLTVYTLFLGEGYSTGSIKDISVECDDKSFVMGKTLDGKDGLEYLTTEYVPQSGTHIVTSQETDISYNKATRCYSFKYVGTMWAVSAPSQYPLYVGQKIQAPTFSFWHRGNYGTHIKDGVAVPGSVSTVEFTITRIGAKDFDAVFSGKTWNEGDRDSLSINNGMLFNAELPIER